MPSSIAKPLALLTSALLLTGCAATPVQVNNPAPAPHFLSCDTVNYAASHDIPKPTLDDLLKSTSVMLKLRKEQPYGERESFGKCPPHDPDLSVGGSAIPPGLGFLHP